MDDLSRKLQTLLDAGADADRLAQAVLASPVVAALKAEAWEQGFSSGSNYRKRLHL